MQETFYFNPIYSIIYHNENSVEFRSGVWNVISHMLNDDSKGGNLAKVILEIDENGPIRILDLSEKTGIKYNECTDIINTLKNKNTLIINEPSSSTSDEKKHTKQQAGLPKFSKIIIIEDGDISSLLYDLLGKQYPKSSISFVSESDLSFLENQGENLFRDNLVLEKVIERCANMFADSLVVSISASINPVFYLLLNKVLHESKVPWFFASIDGPFVYVGPMFMGAFCYECLENRILMNTKNSADYLQYKKAIVKKNIRMAKSTTEETLKHLVCSLMCIEIGSYINTGRNIATHKMLSIYLPTMEFSYHKILRLPGCRVCGVDNALQGHQVHFDTGTLLAI